MKWDTVRGIRPGWHGYKRWLWKYVVCERGLVAELSAVFVQADLGVQIGSKQFTNHAAYLQNWMSLLKDNPNVLFQASADAAKASDFLMAQYGAYLENTKNVKQTVEPLKAQGDLTPKEEKRSPEAQKKRCFHRKKELENEQQEEMEY